MLEKLNRAEMIRRIYLIMPKLNDRTYAFVYRILKDDSVSMTVTQHHVLANLGVCDDRVIKSIYSLIFETMNLPRV
jgi:hypothetical protein